MSGVVGEFAVVVIGLAAGPVAVGILHVFVVIGLGAVSVAVIVLWCCCGLCWWAM